MGNHFTAWVTVVPDCLEGDDADVVVLQDESDDDGKTWRSVANPLFHANLGVNSQTDRHVILDAARVTLARAGWVVTAEPWVEVPTGFVRTVEQA